jgi:hypothetical protein
MSEVVRLCGISKAFAASREQQAVTALQDVSRRPACGRCRSRFCMPPES